MSILIAATLAGFGLLTTGIGWVKSDIGELRTAIAANRDRIDGLYAALDARGPASPTSVSHLRKTRADRHHEIVHRDGAVMSRAPDYRGVAKGFWSGRSQAVGLPAACRFDTTEVEVIKGGVRLTLRPRGKDWTAYFDSGTRGSLPKRRQPPLDEMHRCSCWTRISVSTSSTNATNSCETNSKRTRMPYVSPQSPTPSFASERPTRPGSTTTRGSWRTFTSISTSNRSMRARAFTTERHGRRSHSAVL